MGSIFFLTFISMKYVAAFILITMIFAQTQQGALAEAVVKVANACIDGNGAPASLKTPVDKCIRDALGSMIRRMLSVKKNRRLNPWAWAKKTGCSAAYDGAAGAAGVPKAVSNCFKKDIVTKCVAEVSKLCNC